MATSAVPAGGFESIELRPVSSTDAWDATALLSAMSPAPVQFPPPSKFYALEKALLRQHGWKDPRSLMAYSSTAPYWDYDVFFDAADKTSPVNMAASKAFRCYGLDGKQLWRVQDFDWDVIRGPCLVKRAKPPFVTDPLTGKKEQYPFEFKPLVSYQELIESLLFFKTRDAREVALRRDAQRSMANAPTPPGFPGGGSWVYFGPAGVRDMDKVRGKDTRTCTTCGAPNTIVFTLKACSLCKSAWYCDRECQKKDFKRHKKECAELALKQQ